MTLEKWMEISRAWFFRSEETPRFLRWIYDFIDEDPDDEDVLTFRKDN